MALGDVMVQRGGWRGGGGGYKTCQSVGYYAYS